MIITDRGQPRHVLLTIEEYRRLAGARRSLADVLGMPDGGEIDFDPPKTTIALRPANLD